jgi:hypothetical protein
MSPVVQVVLTSTLTFGVPLVWAVHELFLSRRPEPGSWRPDAPDIHPPPVPPEGEPKRPALPDCLIPTRVVAREIRVPELV